MASIGACSSNFSVAAGHQVAAWNKVYGDHGEIMGLQAQIDRDGVFARGVQYETDPIIQAWVQSLGPAVACQRGLPLPIDQLVEVELVDL